MSKRIPVVIISGFLGAGKTTFLRYLLKNSGKKFGLLINEFGDVGLDGDLINTCNKCNDYSSESIIELNNGCLCCTVQEDFIPSIQNLLELNSDLEAIIIETSGLALPKPLLQALNWPEIRSLVYLDLVIGLVNGESMLDGTPINDLDEINSQYTNTEIIDHKSSIDELFDEQLEVSDVVLISRADLLSESQFKIVKNRIEKKINMNIPILKSFNGELNLRYIFDLDIKGRSSKNIISDNEEHNHPDLFSDSFQCNYFLDRNQLEIELSKILKEINIYRIKGRAWIPNKALPLQIQIVGRKINTWFEEAPSKSWKPISKGGIELIMIGPDKQSFIILQEKIKEKFNNSSSLK